MTIELSEHPLTQDQQSGFSSKLGLRKILSVFLGGIHLWAFIAMIVALAVTTPVVLALNLRGITVGVMIAAVAATFTILAQLRDAMSRLRYERKCASETNRGVAMKAVVASDQYIEIEETEDEGRQLLLKVDDKRAFFLCGQEFYEYKECLEDGDGLADGEYAQFPLQNTSILYLPLSGRIIEHSSAGAPGKCIGRFSGYSEIGLSDMPRACGLIAFDWGALRAQPGGP